MDSIENEVTCDGILVVWNPIPFSMKDPTMEHVFEKCPKNETSHKCKDSLFKSSQCLGDVPVSDWECDYRGHEPGASSDPLKDVIVEQSNISPWVYEHLGLFAVVDIIFEGPFSPHHLPPVTLAEVELKWLSQSWAELILSDVLRSLDLTDNWQLGHDSICSGSVLHLFEN